MSAGLGPAGLGTPLTGSDPPTGKAGVRYLNPITKDYQQDPVSYQLAQMPSVRQRMAIMLGTTEASSSVQRALGLTMPKKIDSKTRASIEQAVRSAIVQLTEVEKVARIDGIGIEIGRSASATGRARVTVSFTDLTTGLQDQVNI